MEEEDNEFFILVLGVLAAIILVITWWFTTGGTTAPVVQTPAPVVEVEVADEAPAEPTPEPTPEPTAEPVVEEAAAPLPSTVFDAVAADSNLSVVRDLLRDNDLDQALAVPGPFTVFAPSNDAIDTAAASDTTAEILQNDSAGVLTYHVVPGSYASEELVALAEADDTAELITVQGEPISLSLDGDDLLVNGSAIVSPESVEADNGLVYTLDNVLVPPVAALNTLVGLEPILFASGSAEIQAESFSTLDSFIEVLQASNVDVNIEGHTDSTGDPVLNQNLSQSRARSVLNYLVANGVDESRLDAVGFGPDRPVADNDTAEGQALNRRIEFTLGE